MQLAPEHAAYLDGIDPRAMQTPSSAVLTREARRAALDRLYAAQLNVLLSVEARIEEMRDRGEDDGAEPEPEPAAKETPEDRANSYSMGVADFFRTCDDKIEWLIDGLIAKGTFTIIQGAPKSGKTFFAAWLTATIAQTRRVVFAEEEGAKEVLRDRLKPFLQPSPEQYNGRLRIIFRKRVRLDVETSVNALIEACYGADVLVLDPFAALHGKDENAASEMGPLLQEIQRIMSACPGLSVILIHHTKKGASWDKNDTSEAQSSESRGSGAMVGAADQMISIKAVPAKLRVANQVRFYVENTDTRMGAPFPKRLAAVDLTGGVGSLEWIEAETSAESAQQLLTRMCMVLQPAPVFIGQHKIREALHVKLDRIREAIYMGIDQGILVQSHAGVALK